jgi:hypothetical protein
MFMFYKDAAPTALQRSIHVLQRCRTYGASTLGSYSTKMPHLRRFNAWFMFYKDAAPTALQRLIHVLQRCRTYGASTLDS